MKLGIQRRTVYLTPTQGMERHWLFKQLDTPEVWSMFGLQRGSSDAFRALHRSGRAIVGVIKRVATRQRIGFVVVFAPTAEVPFWEFGYAITDPRDRDAYAAMNAMDAFAHYLMDHVRLPLLGGRTREDNRAADAVVRRLGYQRTDTRFVDGHNYGFYQMDRALWARRRERLERGELEHPSGAGGAFAVLREPPYHPVVPGG